MSGPLHPTPIRLFRVMWESGLFLNCNVYWDCPVECSYCFSRLNRLAHHTVGKSATHKALGTLSSLVNKAFGPKYDDTDPVQFFLHEGYPVMVSNNTDPLSSLEVEFGYTKQYLETLADCGSPSPRLAMPRMRYASSAPPNRPIVASTCSINSTAWAFSPVSSCA